MTTRIGIRLSGVMIGLATLAPTGGIAQQDAGASALQLTLPPAVYAIRSRRASF